MPKTRDLVRRLRRAGCVLVRHGKRHDIWENPSNGKRTTVPRHASDLKSGTYHAILNQIGLADE